MWNMDFSMPTLVLLVLMFGTYLSRKRLPLRINKVFLGMLITSLLTVVADYVSTLMDEYPAGFSDRTLWLANYMFFVLFLLRSFYLFWFPIDFLEPGYLRKRGWIFFWIGICEQIFLLVFSISGDIFSIHHGAYVSGLFYPFINVQFLVWIFIDLFLLGRLDHPIGVRKTGLYIYLFTLLAGVLIRYAFPHLIIMNLFCLFAIVEVYMFYLSPDQYLDNITTLFNERGWNAILAEATSRPQFCFVGFAIRNFSGLRETLGSETLSFALAAVGSWMNRTWPHRSTFYVGNGVFLLTSPKGFDQKEVLMKMHQRFEEPWPSRGGDFYLSINELMMAPQSFTDDADLLKGTINEAFRLICQPDHRDLTYIDEKLIYKHLRKRHVQRRLAEALSHQELTMFLQPIVNTQNDRVEGAEALCRLKDDKGNYIFPDEFIGLAQKNGTMGMLGEEMFRMACAFMSQEEIRFSNLQWINVNVAPEQFRNPKLLQRFLAILDEYHLKPSVIHLEITEETMIDRTLLHDSMEQFQKAGFIFSMDDFGSSYSNMIRLQQNHFANVKIDREFTWSYFNDKTALLPDIIITCHDMGMKVVTEGVETREMAEGVKAIKADYIQGYYYSKPIPVEDFVKRFISH